MPKTAARAEYCTSSPGLMKWFAIIVSSVILGLLLWDFNNPGSLHAGEQYVVFVAAFTIAICLLLLITYFCGMHRNVFSGLHGLNFLSWVCLLLACLWLAAGGVQTWITVMRNDWPQKYVGQRAAVAALSFLNGLLFLGAMQQVRVVEIYLPSTV